jgi:uncharacterized protein
MPERVETMTDTLPASASPVQPDERYVVMDVVRGFALFGVLAANMRGFNMPLSAYPTPEKYFPGHSDVAVQFLLDWFISGKAYSLFAFLFGLGFAIQITRAQQRNPRFPWFYLRRIAALAVFGLIHGLLIWNGDILVPYAMSAFLLFWFRNAKLKTVSRWVIGVWGLILSAVTTLFVVIHSPLAKRFHMHIGANGPTAAQGDVPQVIAIYQHAHLAGVVRETALLWTGSHPPSHAHKWQWMQGVLAQDVGISVLSFTIFLLGLWVWRRGVLQQLYELRPQLARICRWTLPLGVAMHLVANVAKMHPRYNNVAGVDWALTLCELLGMPTLACGYATALALAFTSDAWHNRVAWLAPAGRMALTNYLTQSVVCVAFYSGILTGLYGRVGPAWDMVATLVLFSAQIAFSHWWLRRFRFGPAEWLWRALTYGKLPPMRARA